MTRFADWEFLADNLAMALKKVRRTHHWVADPVDSPQGGGCASNIVLTSGERLACDCGHDEVNNIVDSALDLYRMVKEKRA